MKSYNTCISFLVSFLFLINVQKIDGESGSGGSMQYISFYNNSGCTVGLEASINSTEYNLTLGNAVSMRVNGMWEIGFCELNSTSERCSINASIYISSEATCVKIDRSVNYTHVQAIRYGDLYQSNGTITCFGSTQFTNVNSKSPVDTKGYNSTVPMRIMSYYFTGNHEWGLYEGANYTGKETCLKPSDKIISRGFGFSYGLTTNLTIRSVGYRCTGGTSTATTNLNSAILFYLIVLISFFVSNRLE